jgi:poly(3-hydroxybutyrate) depolymerase
MKRSDTASSAAPSGKRVRLAIIFMLCALTAPTAAFSQTPAGTVVNESAHFKSLEGNLLKDSADRSFAVYLPFSYQKGRKRYPVIYLLHGGNHSYPAWIDDPHYATVPKIMDKLIASGSVREMIIVMPDGSNAFGNSMWTNSVTTGNWEDYIALDLVDYIDKKYRTDARPASRGIAGHSSGGYGAIKLAMKHPQVFGAVYALSACCLGWDKGWSATSPAWEKALAMRSMDDFTAMAKLVAAGNPRDRRYRGRRCVLPQPRAAALLCRLSCRKARRHVHDLGKATSGVDGQSTDTDARTIPIEPCETAWHSLRHRDTGLQSHALGPGA